MLVIMANSGLNGECASIHEKFKKLEVGRVAPVLIPQF